MLRARKKGIWVEGLGGKVYIIRFRVGSIYIYIHTHTHIYTHTHIHIYTYTHIYIHPYMHACMHTCIHAYMHTYITGLSVCFLRALERF